MKTLLLMRHGKSSWDGKKIKDEERPLKKRGRKDSKYIANILKENELIPQLILASTAERTKETAQIVAEKSGYKGEITHFHSFYMGEPDDFLKKLHKLDDKMERVLLIAHNPGLEAFLQVLCGKVTSLSTATLAYLVLPIDHWEDLTLETEAELIGIWKPKEDD